MTRARSAALGLCLFCACGTSHTRGDGSIDTGLGMSCGDRTCATSEVCCIDCDGVGSCGPSGTVCTGPPCPIDAGPAACLPGTCRNDPSLPCEAPSGPMGNGCCECGADGLCSFLCRCASPETRIATPEGERAIATLALGDLVYSVDRDALVAVPIVQATNAPVSTHRVVRVRLASGRVLEMSPGHPTADGSFFGRLAAGDLLDGTPIESAELVPYAHERTYDILPASDTGTYVAEGVLVGSTLAR